MQLRGFGGEQKVVKPLTTQFVKRQPRLTKPLELKKRPQPKRRVVQRTMVAVKAQMRREEGGIRFLPSQVLGGLSRPSVQLGRGVAFGVTQVEPQALSGTIEQTREAQQRVDMGLELLDLEALDTGEYHALVVQDPEDKRAVKGFCHLAVANPRGAFDISRNGYSFDIVVLPGFHRLVARMNEHTGIKTDVWGRIGLGGRELFKVPWLLLAAQYSFELTDGELQNVGRYLLSGGLVFADGVDNQISPAYKAGMTALLASLLGALRTQGVVGVLEKLPNDHPIYHCYFDFDGPPIGGDGAWVQVDPDRAEVMGYLEGIEIDGRLVATYSRKDYTHAWTFWARAPMYRDWDPTRPLQFGINTIVFALTQEGSITHRLMESVR
jgi:hypothetical protein